MSVTSGGAGLCGSAVAGGPGCRVTGRVLVLTLRASACWPLPARLVAEELARKNHPEGEQSDKCSGRGDGKHPGGPPTLWFRQYCTKLLRFSPFANVKNMLRREKQTPRCRHFGCVESNVCLVAARRIRADQSRLLLAKKNPGKNDPEGEQSGESSSGGDGYHWRVSSEIVITIVSGQVVTSCLRGCKFFVTQKINPCVFPPGLTLRRPGSRPMPGASGRHGAKGGPATALQPPAANYLSLLWTIFLGKTTHSVNNPRKAPAAANAIILTASRPLVRSLWLQYQAELLLRVFAWVNCLLHTENKIRAGDCSPARISCPAPYLPSRRRNTGAIKCCSGNRMPAGRVPPGPCLAPLLRERRGRPW